MKTDIKPENRDGQPRMARMARMKKDFPAQNPEPTCRDGAPRTTPKSGFEQEATERTEIQKATALFPSLTSVQIRLAFTPVLSALESALCSLGYLLFKPIWLRCAL